VLEDRIGSVRPTLQEALTMMAARRLDGMDADPALISSLGIQWPKTLKGSPVPDEAFQCLLYSLRQLCHFQVRKTIYYQPVFVSFFFRSTNFQKLFMREDVHSRSKSSADLLMMDLLIRPVKERQ
jgi:hypothetical protein